MSLNYKEEYVQSLLAYIAYIDMNGTASSPNLINEDLNLAPNIVLFNTNFLRVLIDKSNDIEGNAEYKKSLSSLDFFRAHFVIKKQEVYRYLNGFSAISCTLIKDIPNTKYKKDDVFISYRGTESAHWFSNNGDLTTDFRLTFTDKLYIPFLAQEGYAADFLEDEVNDEKTKNIYVSGHSLGGYLAARSFYNLNKGQIEKIGEVSTFNAVGFSVLDGFF